MIRIYVFLKEKEKLDCVIREFYTMEETQCFLQKYYKKSKRDRIINYQEKNCHDLDRTIYDYFQKEFTALVNSNCNNCYFITIIENDNTITREIRK